MHAAWADLPTEEVLPGITRQVVDGGNQTLVRYVYAPGSVFPVHAHPEEQITVVVSGRIAFEIDGARCELGPGEVAVIPPNARHGAVVVGPDVVETFNALSPRRARNPSFSTTEGTSG
ncbi:MAG: hypothetical protein QOJ59_4085 [Thermomicrobiales bacterium]|jgi:quercetin dioxygenase-like cupin family protein|nr:hypothetical protein [Thermomicrobiales bacterium]